MNRAFFLYYESWLTCLKRSAVKPQSFGKEDTDVMSECSEKTHMYCYLKRAKH